jgi:hypothetical protein
MGRTTFWGRTPMKCLLGVAVLDRARSLERGASALSRVEALEYKSSLCPLQCLFSPSQTLGVTAATEIVLRHSTIYPPTLIFGPLVPIRHHGCHVKETR